MSHKKSPTKPKKKTLTVTPAPAAHLTTVDGEVGSVININSFRFVPGGDGFPPSEHFYVTVPLGTWDLQRNWNGNGWTVLHRYYQGSGAGGGRNLGDDIQYRLVRMA
jgi:hypothetical protein